MSEKMQAKTPAQFYRSIRPEYFSDSELSYESELPQTRRSLLPNQGFLGGRLCLHLTFPAGFACQLII